MSTSFWEHLNHGGLLLSPQALAAWYGTPLPALPSDTLAQLERALSPVLAAPDHTARADALPALLDTLFENLLKLDRTRWRKGPQQVDDAWQRRLPSGDLVRPSRLWLGPRNEVFPVFVLAREGRTLSLAAARRQLARIFAWARIVRLQVVAITNGAELRLCHIGQDFDAFCEWSFDRLIEHGQPTQQLDGLRQLLSFDSLTSDAHDAPTRLLRAIRDSRKGHADLSATLGERVRQAVEELVRAYGTDLDARIDANAFSANDAYIAATRLVMRLVVVFFAEARGLLPVDHPVYGDAYGVQTLRVQLARIHTDRLRQRHHAFPRLLALFRLVHDGSHHEALPVTAYGGGLFTPGDATSADGIARALALFEDPRIAPSDATVHRLLELIATTRVRIRQGRQSTWIISPVDFAGLETEYIGILYEGLLDYELRRAPKNDPVLFLQTASEPALPFSRLIDMSNDALKKLFDALKKADKAGAPAEDDTAADEDSDEDTEVADEVDADEAVETTDDAPPAEDDPAESVDSDPSSPTDAQVYRTWVQDWAERAVKAAGLVKPPRRTKAPNPAEHDRFNNEVTRVARNLYRLVQPGQWYLVRWGGTRKGAGTFYTRPQLAAPTVARTLRPLAFTATTTVTSPRGIVFPSDWKPRPPADILRIKVCDPACGSGAFLISALRFLTNALVDSLHHHGCIAVDPEDPSRTVCRLTDDDGTSPAWVDLIPVPPDHADFDIRLRARVKRHIVEHCLYGVDLDPLAIELARLALWIETLDRDLPFGFIDHKVRAGNALVGTWLDRFQDYPLAAWERKAGDEDHKHFVHHRLETSAGQRKKKNDQSHSGDPWAAALKQRRAEIHSELASWLGGDFFRAGSALVPTDVHGRAMKAFRALHRIPPTDPGAVSAAWHRLRDDRDFRALRDAFDGWCALWFWPCDALELAPGPQDFAAGVLSEKQRAIIDSLARKHRFFHWELAFPDVFTAERRGFDTIVGNPPWEIQKPNSKEFFSAIDPLYRTYGKQEALAEQRAIFERSAADEDGWLEYVADLKARSNWVRFAAYPNGDTPTNPIRFWPNSGKGRHSDLHATWAKRRGHRRGFADPQHPFRHQGSADINTYKMFLELGHALLRPGGRLGMIVPSGVYTDKGTTDLRRLFLDRCRWEWLFAFENREKIFDIHRSFKFGPIIIERPSSATDDGAPTAQALAQQSSGTTENIHVAFMRRSLEDWDDAERIALDYPIDRVARFSPNSMAILEIQDPRDLEVLTKLYTNGVLLGDQSENGWGIKYSTEFHMTNDSKLFPPRPKWEADGYRPDEYGHWLKGPWRPIADFGWQAKHRKEPQYGHWLILDRPENLVLSRDGQSAIHLDDVEGVALPLYQGIMIWQFDYASRRLKPDARRPEWDDQPWQDKVVDSWYLLSKADFDKRRQDVADYRLAFRDIQNATNQRTFIGTIIPGFPAGNTVPVFSSLDPSSLLALNGSLTSFCVDWVLRMRMSQNHVNWFYAEELAAMSPGLHTLRVESRNLVCRLNLAGAVWAKAWSPRQNAGWRELWALTNYERMRMRAILDALAAESFSLSASDHAWLVQDCDWPQTSMATLARTRNLNSKGFWRVDKDKPPELRHTVLAQVAFQDLQRMGLDAFLTQNNGEGWMLPETLRLADYGLGHDDRAKEHQPVARALGPRFHDWQLTQDPAESWEECAAHAALIERIRRWNTPTQATAPTDPAPGDPPDPSTPRPPTNTRGQSTFDFAAPRQPSLFGSDK